MATRNFAFLVRNELYAIINFFLCSKFFLSVDCRISFVILPGLKRMASYRIPQAFVWRRLHSLTGLWFTIFLIQHLFVNSQAGLFLGDDGGGFIKGVNSIHELPYLVFVEIGVLAVPILIHMVWGVQYLFTAKYNSFGDSGTTPYLPEYPRNRAYTWQRITAWFLLFAVVGHVVHMRFIEYPASAKKGPNEFYMVRIGLDDGVQTVAQRLDVEILDLAQIQKQMSLLDKEGEPKTALEAQEVRQQREYVEALTSRPLYEGQGVAVAKNFGTAELMMLRETFQMPVMLVLYTLFVLTACFHAFNGLWTFLFKWGVTVSERSRRLFLYVSYSLMAMVASLGLSAIWLTYWVNLKE